MPAWDSSCRAGLLFPGQSVVELDGFRDEFGSQGVVCVGGSGDADPAVHHATAHHSAGNTRVLEGPVVLILAEADEEAALARGQEEVPVQEPGHAAKHGLLGEAAEAREIVLEQFFEAWVAGYGFTSWDWPILNQIKALLATAGVVSGPIREWVEADLHRNGGQSTTKSTKLCIL